MNYRNKRLKNYAFDVFVNFLQSVLRKKSLIASFVESPSSTTYGEYEATLLT